MKDKPNKHLESCRHTGLAGSMTGMFEVPNPHARGVIRCYSECDGCDRVSFAVTSDKPRRPSYDEISYIHILFFPGDETSALFVGGEIAKDVDPFLVSLVRPHDGVIRL